ncbi:N-6 DNA methylase [Glaesserella parasuis]|uniref:N-6 DNA methylase n=1 Tax=Glaesserella parasuis TaxID=738 RepID=UPI003B1C89A7
MSVEQVQLICPIRGVLKTSQKSKNKLTYTEEYYRIQAIHYLLSQGYPKQNIIIEQIVKKFGNNGRNNFRCDLAVLDVDKVTITNDVDSILEHAIILCEVKKDNSKSDYVKETQVKPLLDFAKLQKCLGLYWDNLEQRVFWQDFSNDKREIREGLINLLPEFGASINIKPISFNETKPNNNLIEIFDYIENTLHQQGFDISARYELILKILLVKIFDEHSKEGQPHEAMEIQDFRSLGIPDNISIPRFKNLLARAIDFYGSHLPKPLTPDFKIKNDALLDILKVLSPIRITYSKRDIIQSFYMKFAKSLYKWDLAQFFTPTPITDFIVDVMNLKFGEHVFDPACGSADFLVAAFQTARKFNHGHADYIWGNDNSDNAVQVAILNMVLNGDGKTNIKKIDSLETINDDYKQYNLILCNPPFGSKILERRTAVLRNFDLGFQWILEKNTFILDKNSLLSQQESGLLFVELCVRKAKKEGRIAIILPNGYLGNRSEKFLIFREWLLRHVKIAGICALPRFSFKSSGADVSASILFLEKRREPLKSSLNSEDYSFFIESIENLGWEAGNKIAKPVYKRNPIDGSFISDKNGELVLNTDFPVVLDRIRHSMSALNYFSWLRTDNVSDLLKSNSEKHTYNGSYCISIKEVLSDPDLTLDPKRYLNKVKNIIYNIKLRPHLRLGDIVNFLPEKVSSSGEKNNLIGINRYKYVQLEDISYGDFTSQEMYGWELPSRAKHFAEPHDLYFGSIWGSAAKWCYIGEYQTDIIVTNGCHRCRIQKGKEVFLADLLAFLNTEAWAIQMRSLARGSDGLAEISSNDAKNIVVPLLSESERKAIQPFVDRLKMGTVSLKAFLEANKDDIETYNTFNVEKRPSHIVLV